MQPSGLPPGLAVVFVQVLTVPLNNLILRYLLDEGALGWLSPSLAKVDLTFLAFILFLLALDLFVFHREGIGCSIQRSDLRNRILTARGIS